MKETDYVYPVQIENVHYGLSARDYIAIQAMTGLLAGISASRGPIPMPSYESIATDCYKMADAMLKQSEVPHE